MFSGARPSTPPTPPEVSASVSRPPTSAAPSPAKQQGAALGTRSSRALGQVLVGAAAGAGASVRSLRGALMTRPRGKSDGFILLYTLT